MLAKNNKRGLRIVLVLSILIFLGIFFIRKDSLAATSYPYYIKVNRQQNVVTIYQKDENGKYTIPVKAMTCSVGTATPLGTYKTPVKYRWKLLNHDVWGQYSTRIVGSILFHSVWYYKQDPSTLSWKEYNKLGTKASQGCIRLTVEDAKWIYDNCPIGTTVEIYDSKDVGPLGKPATIQLKSGTGWDPTDPSEENPFKNKGVAITGVKDKVIEYGTEFNPLDGVKATSTTGFDITKNITIDGKVDTKKVGNYTLTYKVVDEIGRSATKKMVVQVTEPKLAPHLVGIKEQYITSDIKVNRSFALEGVKAYHGKKEIDNEKIKVTIKKNSDTEYKVNYYVKADNGLSASKTVYFYVDYSAPIIIGVENRELTFDEWMYNEKQLKEYALGWLTVSDDSGIISDKDLKIKIKSKSNFVYSVYYEVSDKAGHTTTDYSEFVYFDSTIIEGVQNRYNIPSNTKITKEYALEGITARDLEGGKRTNDIKVNIVKESKKKYKVTYSITTAMNEELSLDAYFHIVD